MSVFLMAYVMIWFGTFEVGVGHYLYLPLGAKILMYLLFGYRVFPGILAGCIAAGVLLFNSWDDQLLIGTMAACAGAVAPIIAMCLMKQTRVSNFSNLGQVDFRHVLFLIVFASVISALLKFFVYMQDLTLSLDAVTFISHYITGDVLGGLVVIYFTLHVIVPLIQRFLGKNIA
ncbi:MASE1 domain-containing protein [Candidatus Thioglobus sp.]|uniref:MASE1 domain-containing protein n=1 Tax=Candidatus Thioglobus sp. TaxID=2026721 RepID=UPI0025BBFC80|nr:MASE1 domain-containing protein [Candidatus Thioglobus sp.]